MKATAVGLCVSVVFGTAASYLRHNNHTSINIMSKYMTGSAFSIVALLSLGGLLSKESSRTRALSPLQHLKVLNYQPRSLSSSISPNSTLYVHSRHT